MVHTAPVVIDLGVLGPADVVDFSIVDDTPRPRSWASVLLGLVVIVGMLTTAVPVMGQTVSLVEVFSADGVDERVVVADGALYTVEAGALDNRVTAYGLDDGKVRWQYRSGPRMTVSTAGPVTLLAPAVCQTVRQFVTHALDRDSGAELWRAPGVPVYSLAASGLVVFRAPQDVCAEANLTTDTNPSYAFTWSGVDARTGAVRWQMVVPPGVRLAAGVDSGRAGGWLAVTEDDLVTTYDLRTGGVIGTQRGAANLTVSARRKLFGVGDQAVLLQLSGRWLTVTAYDPRGLQPLWTVGMPAPAERFDLQAYATSRCGPLLCIGPPPETVAVDPTTGAERWRRAGRPVKVGSGVAAFVSPGPRIGIDPPQVVASDVVTGAIRVRVEGWLPLGDAPGGVLIASTVGGDELWMLATDTGRLRKVTTFDRRYDDCVGAEGYLACRTPGGWLTVWRLPG